MGHLSRNLKDKTEGWCKEQRMGHGFKAEAIPRSKALKRKHVWLRKKKKNVWL